MRQEDLQQVTPGFDDPVFGSQAMFRAALQAMSLPGRPVDAPDVAQGPSKGHGAAARLLLTLLDSDSTLWLSASLRHSDAQAWLRFHTGCQCVDDPAQARFLWIAMGDEAPALSAMDAGSDEYPDQSATCVWEVAACGANGDECWVLEGPGIEDQQVLSVVGLPADFPAQWHGNHTAFPRGVDVFLATPQQLVGLPRSTRLRCPDTVEA